MSSNPSSNESATTESMLKESRRFPPPAEFARQAHVKSPEEYAALHKRSIEDPDAFWAEVAAELHWFDKWDRVLEWNLPDAKWFVNGKTNLCFNCIDRHIEAGHGDKVALVWEGEVPKDDGSFEIERYTYHDLQREVSRFANVLKAQGVKKGDVVTIYMGMVPQLAIAVLACARIGAPALGHLRRLSPPRPSSDRVEDGQTPASSSPATARGAAATSPCRSRQNVDEALQA